MLLADDHKIFRDGVRSILEKEKDIEVVDDAANGKEVIEKIEKLEIDVLVLDIDIGKPNGIEITEMVSKNHPDVKILIFEPDLYDTVKVADLMYMPEFYISSNDSMEKVAEKFETSRRYNLAVIDNGKYLGFLSRAVVFSKYRKTLEYFSHE